MHLLLKSLDLWCRVTYTDLNGPTIHSTCLTKPNPQTFKKEKKLKKKQQQKKEIALQLHLFAMHAPEEEEEEAKPEREPRSEANILSQ